MAKGEPKTKRTTASVAEYLNGVADDEQRRDAKKLVALMRDITGEQPVMWGDSIVGFGTYHYKYASGREGDWMRTGFAVRKGTLTLYIMPGYQDFGNLLDALGPHKHGKSCLYIKRLNDIDLATLKKVIVRGMELLDQEYPRT